jgi:uroporphyrinogen III methyltransferase / synthase
MGVKRLHFIVQQLIQNGLSPFKPAAVIYGGTMHNETVVTGLLKDIEEQVRSRSLDAPGLIVVGDVVRFLDQRGLRDENISVVESPIQEYSS